MSRKSRLHIRRKYGFSTAVFFFLRQTLKRTITHYNCKRGAAARSVCRARWCHASKVPAHINISACGYVRTCMRGRARAKRQRQRSRLIVCILSARRKCMYVYMHKSLSRRHGRDWFSLIGSLFSHRRHIYADLFSVAKISSRYARDSDDKIIRTKEIRFEKIVSII